MIIEERYLNICGFTLVELVATVTVLGIVAVVGAPLIADLVSAVSFADGSSSEQLVIQEAYRRISEELKAAVEAPPSLRPRVSPDGSMIRFYRTVDPADSIRYFFGSHEGSVFLSRTAGISSAVPVPEYAPKHVGYLAGTFSVDGGSYGRCSTGMVEMELITDSGGRFKTDSTMCSFEIFCRNFR